MNSEHRLQLTSKSLSSKNKKLETILNHKESFIGAYEILKNEIPKPSSFVDDNNENKIVEGRDISVCVRVRPMLDYEIQSNYFPIICSSNPKVYTLEPKMSVKEVARPLKSTFDLDFAFGPEHSNDDVYSALAIPLVDLCLRGGISTLFAYGQTGSGKTFTIDGILSRLGKDLFNRQLGLGQKNVKLFMSFYEMLGNEITDLLRGNQNAKISVMEDKFGKITLQNVVEVEIESPEHFIKLVEASMSLRRTETTFKNNASSRSHAICSVRTQNTSLVEAEDGQFFIIDLAGSENASDTQFHDRSLIAETRLINQSLMSLKDCIRNRALSAQNFDKYYHIPFRTSRLTLLMKEAFDLESYRQCKTAVIACVSPSCADSSMTMNTLRYVSPLRVSLAKVEKPSINPNNPAYWNNIKLRQWVTDQSKSSIDPEVLCPFESGMQLLRVPEVEFLQRIMKSNPKIGEKKAKSFYVSLWKLLIDARTSERKKKLKKKVKTDINDFYVEVVQRSVEEKKIIKNREYINQN